MKIKLIPGDGSGRQGKTFNLSLTVGSIFLLCAALALRGQSVLPLAPQPADMPPPGPFTVTAIGYQALPPNDHYSSTALATGHGRTFGDTASLLYLYDAATPDTLTVNFAVPIQLQYGDSPQTVFGVDNSSGAYAGQSSRSLGCLVTASGAFQVDAAVPALAQPLPPNSFLGSYASVLTAADDGRVVGTASLIVHTQTPLNGGDGTVISGPSIVYQFPIFGLGQPIDLSQQKAGVFTRARGFRGTQVVGDLTSNFNYNPADSSPDVWNTASSAWMMDFNQPGSGRVLAGVPSMAAATDGSRQGGWVGLNDGTGNYHATLWSLTGSAVDLNPPGYFDSRVSGMSSEFQAGDGWLGGPANSPGAVQHALLWHGTPDSAFDLNTLLPPSILGAEINGADADGNIVGSYTISLQCTNCTFPGQQQIGFMMSPSPSIALASLSFDSTTPAPGGTVTGTVTLRAAAASGGVPVSFTSSDSSLILPPANIVIPEGQLSASFTVAANPATLTTFMVAPRAAILTAHTLYTSRAATLTVTPTTPTSPISLLTLTPATAAPGDTVTGIVTLSKPAPDGGVIVNFNSGNPALVATPASLTIPAGVSSGSFTCVPADADPLFFAPMQVVLSAQTGNVLRQSTLTVSRVPKPGTIILGTPQNSFTSTRGATSGVGFVSLSTMSHADGTIIINNNNPALILPTSVPVQAGTWMASVPWTALPVATEFDGVATATFNGFTSSNILSVTPSPSPTIQSLTIPIRSPSQTFSSGDILTGTVTLSSAAFLGGMTVALSSDAPAVAQVPASVLVPSVGTSVSFSVVAGPVAGPTPVTITATLAGFAPVSVPLTVIPGPALAITSYSINPYAIIGPGVSTTGTITLNQPAPAGGVTVSLSASNPQPAKFPATISFAAGQNLASFSIQGNSVSAATPTTLVASYKGPLAPLGASASTSLTVAPTDTLHVTKVTWSKSTQALTVTASSTNPQAIINVLNANGNVPLGVMSNQGNGSYTFGTTIASISSVNLRSSLGGATGQGVTVIQ